MGENDRVHHKAEYENSQPAAPYRFQEVLARTQAHNASSHHQQILEEEDHRIEDDAPFRDLKPELLLSGFLARAVVDVFPVAAVGRLPLLVVEEQGDDLEQRVEVGVDVHLLLLHELDDLAVDDGLLLGRGVGNVGIGGAALELGLLGEDVHYGAIAVCATVVFGGARG